MEPSAELTAEIDAISITCDMQHPDPGRPHLKAEPCTAPAKYFATVHDCRKKRDTSAPGTTLPICDDYITYVKGVDYPHHCTGCGQEITSLLGLIWDIRHIPA